MVRHELLTCGDDEFQLAEGRTAPRAGLGGSFGTPKRPNLAFRTGRAATAAPFASGARSVATLAAPVIQVSRLGDFAPPPLVVVA